MKSTDYPKPENAGLSTWRKSDTIWGPGQIYNEKEIQTGKAATRTHFISGVIVSFLREPGG